jgi:hypothetical protein
MTCYDIYGERICTNRFYLGFFYFSLLINIPLLLHPQSRLFKIPEEETNYLILSINIWGFRCDTALGYLNMQEGLRGRSCHSHCCFIPVPRNLKMFDKPTKFKFLFDVLQFTSINIATNSGPLFFVCSSDIRYVL